MKRLFKFQIELTLQGPILTKSTSPSDFGLDAAVARDFRTHTPCIPGTLIEGKVREALFQLGKPSLQIEELFGRDTLRDSGNEPKRGSLVIHDLLAQSNGKTLANLSRIKLDHALGSAQGQMLRVIETPFLAGERVKFVGSAIRYATQQEAEVTRRELLNGLRWLTQIGAQRTTGFGRLLHAEVFLPNGITPIPRTFSNETIALEFALHPQGPLCISRPKIGDNLFESDDVIPGNMLAGAIKQTANALRIQIPSFNEIRFRHAFATTGAVRPRTLPLSTVKAGSIPYDIADFRDPVLLKNDKGRFRAPAFPIDWKEHGDVLGKLGWANPARELRVRTAIDSQRRTAERGRNGEAGKLFAWEMIHPTTDDGAAIFWRARIDLGKVPAGLRAEAATALDQVLQQLGFLSKTKALCPVQELTRTSATETASLSDGQALALVLQTPALLADPRFQSVPRVPKAGALSAVDMLTLYRAVWQELSGGFLDLSHHFARQFLAGGNHLTKRFQNNKPYDPWLLTDAGSVFVFKVTDAIQAKTKVEEWLAGGLPIPQWAVKAYADGIPEPDRWRCLPYIPQNGFGEIALHQPAFATPQKMDVASADPILP